MRPQVPPVKLRLFGPENNVERINIRGSSLPVGVSSITVTVSAYSLTGDGISPETAGRVLLLP